MNRSVELIKCWEQGLLLADPKKWYLVIPEGEFDHPSYGKLDFNEAYLQELKDNFDNKALGETRPFVDINHNEEEAFGWFEELRLTGDGMEGLIKWNEHGVELIKSGSYKYFSPWISPYKNPITGTEYANVFRGGALTNVPFLKMLPEIELSNHQEKVYRLSELAGDSDKKLKEEMNEVIVGALIKAGGHVDKNPPLDRKDQEVADKLELTAEDYKEYSGDLEDA